MIFDPTPLPGVYIVKPQRFNDNRGYFMETYNKAEFTRNIGNVEFIQDNESESVMGVLRGLHLQSGAHSQAKLVRVVQGKVFDVVVDLRPDSMTYGKWFGVELSHENGFMVFVPRGFAHGFVVLSPKARFVYKVDNSYAPDSEVTIAYDDSQLAIRWPEVPSGYILSDKDRQKAISFRDYCRRFRD